MKGGAKEFVKQVLQRLGLFGLTFRLHESLKARRENRLVGPAPDGLAVPPSKLIVLVEGDADAGVFLRDGAAIAETIAAMLAARGAPIESMRSILDFGCGCGRVLRHFQRLRGRVDLHGSDYNRTLVDWCRDHLPFAQFNVNQLEPPLDYRGDTFNLVYANSVFTHLPADLQLRWIDELTRVTTPGGHLLISVHGKSFRATLTTMEQAAFDRGELVVRYPRHGGSNLCAAFHPEAYVRDTLARGLEVIDYSAAGLGQDAVLLRKPAAN